MFHTQYVAWLDIGLFRELKDETDTFSLSPPADLDEDKVAYSRQNPYNASLTPREVVRGNWVWVGGAMFLGRPEVLYVYTQDYMKAVRKLLEMGLMSTDQQVGDCNWVVITASLA